MLKPQGKLASWLNRKAELNKEVVLSSRKVYVMPTKAGAGLALVLIVMLLAAINYQNSLAYGLTFTLASLTLVALLHTWRNLVGLVIQSAGTQNCFPEQQAGFQVRALNTRAKTQRYAIGMGWHKQALQRIDIAADGETVVQLNLDALQRGRLQGPSITVETRYPLGIWRAWGHFKLDQTALVYPRPIQDVLAGGSSGDNEHDDATQMLKEGVDDYEGLRTWQPGDSLKRVNWKAWSRGQGLLVKTFSQLQGEQHQLSFAALNGDIEYRLSVLTYHVLQLTAQQQVFELHLPQQTLGPATGLAHQTACLRALALFGEQDVK